MSLHDICRGCRLTSWLHCADPRVAVASMSALAASQPSVLNSSTSLRQDPGSSASPMDMQSALAELGTLRSEMAALQAALTVLKGITHSTSQQDCNRALQPDGSCASPPAHHDVHTVPIIQYKTAADPLQVAYVRHLSRMACQQLQNVLCLFLGVHRSPCMVLNA